MTYTVWKFALEMTDHPTIPMPRGAHVLAVQVQGTMPFVWAMVDPDQPLEDRKFRLAGTGHPIEHGPELHYIGTFQLLDGGLIFHLFEVPT